MWAEIGMPSDSPRPATNAPAPMPDSQGDRAEAEDERRADQREAGEQFEQAVFGE